MESRSVEDSWELSTGNADTDRRNLRLLTDAAAELYGDLDPEERLKRVIDRAIMLTGAEFGLLFLLERGDLDRRCARDANGQDVRPWPKYSHRIVRDVWRSGEMQVHDQFPKGAVGEQTITDLMLQSVTAVRLAFGDEPIGVLYTQASFCVRELSKADRGALRGLAGLAATAVQNQRLQDSERSLEELKKQIAEARDVQARLRPSIDVVPEGLDVFGAARICQNLSGDYYDVIPRPDGCFALAVGDVRNHGIRAAVHMTTARALLHRLMEEGVGAAEALQIISRHFAVDMEVGDFMTLFLGIYDPRDRSLRWASAGHNPPLLRRADGTVEELAHTGTMLRLMPEQAYRLDGPLELASGDVLLLYTDGIVEAWCGEAPKREMWGDDCLRASLDRLVREGRDVQRITAGLLADMDAFRNPGPLEDDITLLVVKVL